ncbi:MAG: efflux RND transporter periplasmic adaptor subunit [Bacteroidia bacterium]
MNTRYIAALILLSLSLVLGSCGKSKEQAATETKAAADIQPDSPETVTLSPDQEKSLGIQLGTATARTMRTTLSANGLLDVPPQNMVSISAPFGGFLKESSLLPGSRVNKGQVIATLEHPDFVTMQQEYLENLSQSTYLDAEYKRQQTLAAENVNARKALEKARADYETIQARLKGQRAKLEMLQIDLPRLEKGEIVKQVQLRSPISGYVTDMLVTIGAHLNPTDVLFKIADTGHLHAELTVYEQDIRKLQIGQKVSIRIGNETMERPGTIHLLGREVGPDRTVKIHVHLDQEDPLLIPGTFLTAKIELAATEAQAVPEDAIVPFGGKDHVFISEGNHHYRMQEVRVMSSEGGFSSLDSASTAIGTQQVVVHGGYKLLSILKNTEEE